MRWTEPSYETRKGVAKGNEFLAHRLSEAGTAQPVHVRCWRKTDMARSA